MAWHETEHADRNAMDEAVARRLNEAAETALRARGQAWVTLAGGTTPLPAYRLWSSMSAADERLRILPTDERWVDAGHPACNLSRLGDCFPRMKQPCLLPLAPESVGDLPDCRTAERSLSAVPGRFDAVLLGMGTDGHFASLFPGAPELAAGLDPDGRAAALVVHPDPLPPEAPFARISLSLPRLLSTHRLLLMIAGEAKRDVLRQAQRLPDPRRWPITALLHADEALVEIHWSP